MFHAYFTVMNSVVELLVGQLYVLLSDRNEFSRRTVGRSIVRTTIRP